MGTWKLSDFWLNPVRTKTKQGQMTEQRLFWRQLQVGIWKLPDFWLSPVPTKTKQPQSLEQLLYVHQLPVEKGSCPISVRVLQARTDDGTTPLFIAAADGHLEVVRCLVESSANKDQATTELGTTPLCT